MIRSTRSSWRARSGVPRRARRGRRDGVLRERSLRAGGSWSNRSVWSPLCGSPHGGGNLLVGEFELIDQLLVGRCSSRCVEVSPVDVLDKCLFEAVDVARGRLDKDRDGLKAGPARRLQRRSPR